MSTSRANFTIGIIKWTAECTNKGCRFYKTGDYLNTRVNGGQHARERPGHRVILWKATVVDSFNVEDQDQLPFDNTEKNLDKTVDTIPF